MMMMFISHQYLKSRNANMVCAPLQNDVDLILWLILILKGATDTMVPSYSGTRHAKKVCRQTGFVAILVFGWYALLIRHRISSAFCSRSD